MIIKEFKTRYRRDFTAIYKCQFCKAEIEEGGYDDSNFHNNVIPDMICKKCNKSTNSEKGEYNPLATRYSENQIV